MEEGFVQSGSMKPRDCAASLKGAVGVGGQTQLPLRAAQCPWSVRRTALAALPATAHVGGTGAVALRHRTG